MFGKMRMTKSTGDYSAKITALKEALDRADAVVIGAGAGLSTAAGFVYNGERFEQYFADFRAKYGFKDMYSGGFYPYEEPEQMWAYWSRYIYVNRYMDPPKPVYSELLRLVEKKDYFVLTTNVDHCFQKAGFAKDRLFYTQGDYGLFQCSEPCSNDTYDNEAIIRRMVEEQKDMCIPSKLVPKCPHCGEPLTMNLRSDHRFVEDKGWKKAAARYEDFLHTRSGSILYLELGVGYNTPGIIKYPFWQRTSEDPKAVYACVNFGESICPQEIANRAILIDADIAAVLNDLRK